MSEFPKTSSLRQGKPLAQPQQQLGLLALPVTRFDKKTTFADELNKSGLAPLTAVAPKILQINLGKMCNQTCKHCHVDAGPDRKEIMSLETIQACLDALDMSKNINTVDLTGGAPEMNPHFRWLVGQLRNRGIHVMVRCNLTIILAHPQYRDLPSFFAGHQVEVVSSLPHYSAFRTDAQRGQGVFEKSIEAIKRLNEHGYGMEGTGLVLNLVYNPSGAFMPASQASLEAEFKRKLQEKHGLSFNRLFSITNLPVSRFLEYLTESGNYEAYMRKLAESFNPLAAGLVMCRDTVSVGWDGALYDCDFNQMLGLKLNGENHIRGFNPETLCGRKVVVGQHCFGCTAGAGSSCGGEVIG